jgi:hypothetical protein
MKDGIKFDKTEAIANVHSYRPHIWEMNEAIGHPQNFICGDGYKLSKAWSHIFVRTFLTARSLPTG